MQNDVILSICIPTYNRKEILKDTLDEIFSYPNNGIEVIVIDNASTDGTREMLDNYKDIRLTVKHNDIDKGMFDNQLEALFSGSGKYTLVLMDRDRIFAAGMQELIHFLKRTDIGIIHIDNRVKKCRYEKGGRAASYVVIRTHPSQLIYKTNLLNKVGNKEKILNIIKGDADYAYSYPEIIGLLILKWNDKICLYPCNDLVQLEVKKVKSYTKYKMKLKNTYYMPEGSKRRYLKCVEELMPVYGKKKITEYLPYIFASELYWGSILHYNACHDREFAYKYNVKKIGFIEYWSYAIGFYNTAIKQQKKLKIFRIKTIFVMLYILSLYLLEIYILLKVPSKRRWLVKIDSRLSQLSCGMY